MGSLYSDAPGRSVEVGVTYDPIKVETDQNRNR